MMSMRESDMRVRDCESLIQSRRTGGENQVSETTVSLDCFNKS